MVEISIEGDRVNFNVEGWDRLWALKSQLSIPLVHIRRDPERTIVLELEHEKYSRLIVEVEDTSNAVAMIKRGIESLSHK